MPHARSPVRRRARLSKRPGPEQLRGKPCRQRPARRPAAVCCPAAAPRRHAPAAADASRRRSPTRLPWQIPSRLASPTPPLLSRCRRPSRATRLPAWAEAAATGAAVGLGAAAGIASNMASTRAPAAPARPARRCRERRSHSITSAQVTIGRERSVSVDCPARPLTCRVATPSSPLRARIGRSRTSIPPTARFVNNRRITRCPLRNGDLLTFGLEHL